jgi:ABC-type phosphate transport system ATPase subunit
MDIRGLKLTALRRNIGVVFQEALLFNRSIADNLRVGKPDATDEEMRIAAGARRRSNSSSAATRNSRPMPASAAACCPAASGSGCRSRARC